jgi:hypothetical protein
MLLPRAELACGDEGVNEGYLDAPCTQALQPEPGCTALHTLQGVRQFHLTTRCIGTWPGGGVGFSHCIIPPALFMVMAAARAVECGLPPPQQTRTRTTSNQHNFKARSPSPSRFIQKRQAKALTCPSTSLAVWAKKDRPEGTAPMARAQVRVRARARAWI